MPLERAALAALVHDVGRFYVRDKKLQREQQCMQRSLEAQRQPAEREIRAYLTQVERYFSGFEREARAHLKDVDRRLVAVSQVQFNLTAERGVAARRVEVTQGVLSRLAELARR